MKKFYTLALSLLCTLGVFAATTTAAKIEKNRPQIDFSTAKIEKVSVEKGSFATNSKNMFKAPQDATTDFASVAGTYLFQAYLLDRTTNAAGDGMISVFEITEPDAEGNCLIKNFLADWYGIQTNDLNAQLYNEVIGASSTSEGFEATFLKIGLGQDLFTDPDDNITVQLYLYGPLAGDGKNYVFTGSEIEFIVYSNGFLSGAYNNMGMWVGYESNGSLYGYTPFVGLGGESKAGVEAMKPNSTMTAEQYIDNETKEPATFPVYAEYYEEYSAIITVNFGGSGETIIWYVEPEDGLAEAVDQYVGSVTLRESIEGYPAGNYPCYLYTGETEEHIIADAELVTDPETGNTSLTVSDILFLSELGWIERFENVKVQFPFNITGESGIADVIANDNSNAPVEYFNLQGVKVENPAAGLYIRRQGNQATKVLVK